MALIAPQRPIPPVSLSPQRSAVDQAFEFQRLLEDGVVNNRAEIAERFGVSRARVTQVLNILRLPQTVLSLLLESSQCEGSRCTERQLRRIPVLPSAEAQPSQVYPGSQAEKYHMETV